MYIHLNSANVNTLNTA